ncbi:MAG: acyl-CoA thioesterase/bile acid-CoA:amino acid N-acyltransferase family protein [Phycisphaerae bacterium]
MMHTFSAKLSLFTLALVGTASAIAEPKIVIEPDKPVILGEDVAIRVTGLQPGQMVSLVAESAGPAGKIVRAAAEFEADPNGNIDLARNAPVSGSYRGINQLGIFWSRNNTAEPTPDALKDKPGQSQILFKVKAGDKELCRKQHVRYLVAPGVKESIIRQGRLKGKLFVPPGEGPFGGVVCIGSIDNPGWAERTAGLLASHGMVAVGLAYYNQEGLPPALDKVPLEYFTEAISYVRDRSDVDDERVGLVGHGKGAEVSLILGSRVPEVRAVVAFAPSSVVWQSPAKGFPVASSWIYQGQPLAFLPFRPDEKFSRTGRMADLHQASLDYFLEHDRDTINRSAIVIEQTQGPVLMVSGDQDAFWPADVMGHGSFLRLSATKHPYEDDHLIFENAGHDIGVPGYTRTVNDPKSGGSREANAHARRKGWQAAVALLKRTFKVGS